MDWKLDEKESAQVAGLNGSTTRQLTPWYRQLSNGQSTWQSISSWKRFLDLVEFELGSRLKHYVVDVQDNVAPKCFIQSISTSTIRRVPTRFQV